MVRQAHHERLSRKVYSINNTVLSNNKQNITTPHPPKIDIYHQKTQPHLTPTPLVLSP
ncbi:Uncharacterised protein [Moraxella lacunata]|uniref:Uncharacterized protein n=1 Tax=Moraxella lacunata TaxID=477 RepID=A0A378T552_MORLA|nr:Uncharacterised protein [Moraxella lacunata]